MRAIASGRRFFGLAAVAVGGTSVMWVVIAYKFEWSTEAHTGKFQLKLANFRGNLQWTDLTVSDAAEFGTILQMLRSEYALTWDDGTLTTMFTEEAGEDEGGGGA